MVAYLYPGYASYKTLSQRPANEADIERWLMYWSVIGCVVAVESVEWLVNWSVCHPNPSRIPFQSLILLLIGLRTMSPTRTSSALQDTAVLSHQNNLHPLPRPTPNQGFIVSLHPPSPTLLPRTRTPNRRHSFFCKNTLVCVCSGKTPQFMGQRGHLHEPACCRERSE